MTTKQELARQIIKRTDIEAYNDLMSKGYNVLRKSSSTKVMVLWGESLSESELASIAENEAKRARLSIEGRLAEQLFIQRVREESRKERLAELTVANLWRHFCRKQHAHRNIKGNSFYFTTQSGSKVRVSDHESWHFQLPSEKSAFSRADDFSAPDFDFVIAEFEGMTKQEAVNHINSNIQ